VLHRCPKSTGKDIGKLRLLEALVVLLGNEATAAGGLFSGAPACCWKMGMGAY